MEQCEPIQGVVKGENYQQATLKTHQMGGSTWNNNRK